MFRIGEFSKIAQTAVSQLRYYDRIGLFQPEYTDPFTGYRYYRAAQLPDLNRILALKELGLTLEQIQRLVVEDVSADEIRGMLALKKAQVEQELHAALERLHYIEARLRQVDKAGNMPPDDVVIKELPACPFLGLRVVLPDIRGAIKHRLDMSRLLPSHLSPRKVGHFVALLHEDAFIIEDADIEMGFLLNEAVAEPIQLGGDYELAMRILPRVAMAACAVRLGGFENGYESYSQIGHWIEVNGYQMNGPVRELFIHQAPMERIDEMVCEIQVPVVPVKPRSLTLNV